MNELKFCAEYNWIKLVSPNGHRMIQICHNDFNNSLVIKDGVNHAIFLDEWSTKLIRKSSLDRIESLQDFGKVKSNDEIVPFSKHVCVFCKQHKPLISIGYEGKETDVCEDCFPKDEVVE
jgi:hypothetical protein